MRRPEVERLGFTMSVQVHGDRRFPVFTSDPTEGSEAGRPPGRGVVLIHEMPGITREVGALGRFLVDRGFTVWMPYLFASDLEPGARTDGWGSTARACVFRQLCILSTNRTSPTVDWLRWLASRLHDEVGGPGVGVVGMCFSGGYALATVLEPSVIAPVMSQPALPFRVTPRRARALGLSASDAIAVGRRMEADGLCALGFRFTRDVLVRPGKFERLGEVLDKRVEPLGEVLDKRFEPHEMASGPPTPFGRFAHSVLTREAFRHPDDPEMRNALDRVVGFLAERLGQDVVQGQPELPGARLSQPRAGTPEGSSASP